MPKDVEHQKSDRICLVVDDMFFASKILGAAETAGRRVERIKSLEQLEREMTADPPAFLIVDLNSDRMDPLQAIEFCRSRPELSGVPILGFVSHVQVALKRAAEEAGCDLVLPRSQFTQKLNEIVSGTFEVKPRH
ncbi:MAG: response regulator [Blastocatellia bacterium]|nr:response regulator [Blastocatellia bacterium]